MKFNNAGVRQWATLYGGDGNEFGQEIISDAVGNIYVTGSTSSANFPVQLLAGAFFDNTRDGSQDAFILKFDNLGVRKWATFHGGTGVESGNTITSDNAGNLYVAGHTNSTDFPTTVLAGAYNQTFGGGAGSPPPTDAFILKFDNAGALTWATCYGGTDVDWAWGVATDASGNVYVTGFTWSANFPVQVLAGAYNQAYGGFDAFILKFNSVGVRQWATCYGGATSGEEGNEITVDLWNNVFVTGITSSTDFPTQDAGGGAYYQNTIGGGLGISTRDMFILKFNSAGARQWATYYGGNANDQGNGITTDPVGTVYVTGMSYSTNFPVLTDGSYYQASPGGSGLQDVVILRFTNSGTREWATFYGGPLRNDWGTNLKTDASGCLFVTGELLGGGVPLVQPGGAYQDSYHSGGDDGFIIKFCPATLALNVLITKTDPGCSGNNGIATATVTGGTVPYTYFWSPGGKTTQTITGLVAGTYTVIVTDASLATITKAITITQLPALTITLTSVSVNCYGNNTGSATVSASGGTSPYTYSWSNTKTGITITGLALGNYTVTLTDANGCTTKSSVTISEPPLLAVTISSTSVTCNGNNNGTATTNVSGGTSPYVYSWNNSATTFGISNLISQIYPVTVTDANGCSSYASGFINQPSAITATVSVSTTSCLSSVGSVTLSAVGGTGSYTYLWSNGATTSIVTGLGAANFQYTITDANLCTKTGNVQVSNFPGVNPLIASTASVTCFGLCDAALSVSSTGGNFPYFYSWSNGSTAVDLTGLCAGIYSTTVTDFNGCSSSTLFNITQPPLLSTTITTTNVSCYGGNDGSTITTTNGGTSPYVYQWSNGANQFSISNLQIGNYTVTITDANGCINTGTITITESTILSATITAVNSTCNNNNGSAVINASGGTLSYQYRWNTGDATNQILNLQAGIYSATVTDNNGCVTSATVTIIDSNSPITGITIIQQITCYGADDGIVTATVSGGASPIIFNWSNGANTSTISNLPPSVYSVTVTDNNGCTDTASVIIAEPALLTVTISAVSGCSIPDPSASASANGGTSAYSYEWSNGKTQFAISNLQAGNYTITVTDNNGCVANATVTIFGSTLTAAASGDVTIAIGDSTILSASGGGSYQWSPSIGLSCTTCANPTAKPQITTIYCVDVTDVNGCTDTACVTVTVDTICAEIFIPTAFSPNKDTENEILCIYGTNCIKSITFTIYSRWGEKVFDTTNPKECWDGYFNKTLNTGIFIYKLQATLTNGEKVMRTGNISLIR